MRKNFNTLKILDFMALKVKAVERLLKFTKNENDPGVYRYVMKPELYIALTKTKVIKEAALRSGVSQGVMKACWDAHARTGNDALRPAFEVGGEC